MAPSLLPFSSSYCQHILQDSCFTALLLLMPDGESDAGKLIKFVEKQVKRSGFERIFMRFLAISAGLPYTR